MRWQMAKHVAWQTIDGEAMIVDVSSGGSLGLNAAGTFVWIALQDHSEEETATLLAEKYALDPAAAAKDVRAIIDQLAKRGLLIPLDREP